MLRSDRKDGKIDVFIEREDFVDKEPDLFDKKVPPIKSIEIVDNGEGVTEANFNSFNAPFSKLNKQFGCKGVGRFTMLAMFGLIKVVSTYKEDGKWYRRKFSFDAEREFLSSRRGDPKEWYEVCGMRLETIGDVVFEGDMETLKTRKLE